MNADHPTAPKRRGARHATTRRQILDQTWKLALELGLTGWTLKDVADAVGMRAPSLYVYFSGKNDLYDALFADGYTDFLAAAEGIEGALTPEEAVRRAARLFVDFAVANPPRHQLLFQRTISGFEPSPASYALAVETVQRTAGLLTAAGARSTEDLDLYTALVTGLASQQISNDPGGTRWRNLIDDAVTMFLTART